jgi:hypothetical protein
LLYIEILLAVVLILISDQIRLPFERDLYPTCSGFSAVAASYSIRYDTAVTVTVTETLISVAIRNLCYPAAIERSTYFLSYFIEYHLRYILGYSAASHRCGCTEAESIAVFRALKENTGKCIDFILNLHSTQNFCRGRCRVSRISKTLQTLQLGFRRVFKLPAAIALLRALSRNTSVTELIVSTDVVKSPALLFKNF